VTRVRKPSPDELQVEKIGLGYVGTLVSQGIALSFDRIVESRGEIQGELTVERAPEGHLLRAKFSASSRADRDATARDLGGRSNNIVWRDVLESFCLEVLKSERVGQPFEQVGTEPPAADVDWLLRPLLERGQPTIVFGEGDAGKSTLAAAAAVMVKTGFTTITGWEVTTPGEVLVVDWEDQRLQWNDRVAGYARAMGVAPPSIHYRRGMGTSLPDQLHEIAQHIAQHDVALLIVDSVGLAMPTRGDGADANEAALRLFAALRHLSVTTLLLDHVAGADVGAEKSVLKPYGSVYKKWLARSVWELRAMAPTPDAMHVGLYHSKFNAGPKSQPMGLAIYHGPGEIMLTREDLDMAEANSAIPLHSRIYTLLLAGGKDVRALSEALNEPPNKIRSVLSRMAEMGKVSKLPGKAGIWAALARPSVQAQQEAQQMLRSGVVAAPVGNREEPQWD
jgi:hypothetical protein